MRSSCLHCSAQIDFNPSQKRGRFCSSKCLQLYAWEKRMSLVLSRGSFPFSYDGNRRSARRFLLERHGAVCAICGLSEWMGKPVPVVVDHIDGHSENWGISNLRLICCNCDAQTETYKSKNRGNGRHFRRERYQAGKSY